MRVLAPRKELPFVLIGAGLLTVYAIALLNGPFRPKNILPFLILFVIAFMLYALACWFVIKRPVDTRRSLLFIFGGALLFNAALFPMLPTLSDDMYRYVWDGRVQANGINPYRYASDADQTAYLRDPLIWSHMNRRSAITVYPPGAQLAFATIWRIFPDSIAGFKLIFILSVIIAGGLLVPLLKAWGVSSGQVLIFLWNPLLIFEIAHSAHVDALYLPLIIGALLLRQRSPVSRVSWKHEIGIGLVLGAATLIKLYPILLVPVLWSVQGGRFRGRLLLPVSALLTIGLGYGLYIAPGVDTLGFLSSYTREFFNIGPFPMTLVSWAEAHNIAYYQPTTLLLPLVIVVLSLYFVIKPAPDAKTAIRRCLWPIGATLLITINLFSWYVLWTLPFIALDLQLSIWRASFGWWLFSGLVALSYTLFITGYAQPWVAWLEFVPLYGILIIVALRRGWQLIQRGQRA